MVYFIITIESQEDAFKFVKALKSEVWETQFLISCGKIIKIGMKAIHTFSQMIYREPSKE